MQWYCISIDVKPHATIAYHWQQNHGTEIFKAVEHHVSIYQAFFQSSKCDEKLYEC